MSNNTFDEITEILETELRNQLSPAALTVLMECSGDNTSLLRLAPLYDLPGRQIAIIRQINDFRKKFIGISANCVPLKVRNKTCWDTFVSANKRCYYQNSAFHLLDADVMTTLELARNDIYKSFWGHVETDDFEFLWCNEKLIPISGFSTGPGSCTGVKGVSLIEKYRNEWHVSTEYGKSLLNVLRKVNKPIHDLPNFAVGIVSAVEASMVPKSQETSRLIAPQLNGDLYLQYPAACCLTSMLKKFCIDLTTQQDKNRAYARQGSLHDNCDIYPHHLKQRRWRPCTIDLKSASDIVGVALTQYLLPPQLFEYMNSCRSGNMLSEFQDKPLKLSMMATMGNAFCFPLQTLIFCAIVRAVYYRLGIPLTQDNAPTYGVYGDDIIVDVTAYPYVIKVLELLNMQANQKKSFSYGLFRESCGGDFYNGYGVRPIHCEVLETDCDYYSLINRLLLWGANNSVCVLKTVRLLFNNLTVKTLVPMDYGTHTGLNVPELAIRYFPPEWRESLHCSSQHDRSFLLQYSIELDPNINNLCSHRIIGFESTVRNSNVYSSYIVTSLDVKDRTKEIRLSKEEMSLFPFLRGGVSQTGDLVYAVTARDTSVVREHRVVSLWDVPLEYQGALGVFFGSVLRYYATVFEQLWSNSV